MDLSEAKVVKTGHNHYAVIHGDDSNNYVEFEQVAVKNEAKSAAVGHPVFDDVDFIKIMFPGDKTKVVFKKVNEEYKQRYPKQWAAYKAQELQVQEGFPINEWPVLTKAEAANLKANGIHTVEQLANIPDTALGVMLGARTYREKARATLSKAADGKAVLAMQAENETLKADIEALKQQVKELANPKTTEKDKK